MKNRCNKPETVGHHNRFTGTCKHCRTPIIRNKGKWFHTRPKEKYLMMLKNE